METNWNHLIERYLQGELSPDGIEAFEHELNINPDLQMEFELHNLINESVGRSIQRQAIQQLGAKYHFKMKMKKWMTYTSVVSGAAATTIMAIYLSSASPKNTLPVVAEKDQEIERVIDSVQEPVSDSVALINTITEFPTSVNAEEPGDVQTNTPLTSSSKDDSSENDNPDDQPLSKTGTPEIREEEIKNTPAVSENQNKPVNSKNTKSEKIAEQSAKAEEEAAKKVKKVENAKFVLGKGFDNPKKFEAKYLNSFDLPFFTYNYGNLRIFTDKDNYMFYNIDNNTMIVLPKKRDDVIKIVTNSERVKPENGNTRVM